MFFFYGEVLISNLCLLANKKPNEEQRPNTTCHAPLKSTELQPQPTTKKGPETADPRETHLDTAGHQPGVFTAD